MSLTWERASKYHMQTACGRYSVAKVFTLGLARYESWVRQPDQLLATHDTADQAQARCQTHHDSTQANPNPATTITQEKPAC